LENSLVYLFIGQLAEHIVPVARERNYQMSPSTQIGFFAPPAMAVLVFLMGCDREVGAGRNLGAEKVTFLAWFSLFLMILMYAIIWQKEIVAFLFH
jgi:hypothetical protein